MLHTFKQSVYILRLGNKGGLSEKSRNLRNRQPHIPLLSVKAHGVPEMKNTDNVIQIFLKNRKTAFAFAEHVIDGIA